MRTFDRSIFYRGTMVVGECKCERPKVEKCNVASRVQSLRQLVVVRIDIHRIYARDAAAAVGHTQLLDRALDQVHVVRGRLQVLLFLLVLV